MMLLIFILIIILSIPIGNSGQRIIDFGFFKYIKNPLFNRVGNEYTILEIFQEIILLYSIFITLKIRKKFIRYSNILSFSLRLGLLLFLFFEEISFLTMGRFDFTNTYNLSNQLNIHNAKIGNELLINNFQIPFINHSFNLSWYASVLIISTFIIGYGNYFKIFKSINLFFLEKKYSVFFLIFTFNIISRAILFKLNIINEDYFIDFEIVELYLYFVLLVDTILKRNKVLNFRK